MKKLKVYVGGPILGSGNLETNIQNAVHAGQSLWKAGFVPFIPHLDQPWNTAYPKGRQEWLDYDRYWLAECDLFFRLPGKSPGTDQEERWASQLNIPIFYSLKKLITDKKIVQTVAKLCKLKHPLQLNDSIKDYPTMISGNTKTKKAVAKKTTPKKKVAKKTTPKKTTPKKKVAKKTTPKKTTPKKKVAKKTTPKKTTPKKKVAKKTTSKKTTPKKKAAKEKTYLYSWYESSLTAKTPKGTKHRQIEATNQKDALIQMYGPRLFTPNDFLDEFQTVFGYYITTQTFPITEGTIKSFMVVSPTKKVEFYPFQGKTPEQTQTRQLVRKLFQSQSLGHMVMYINTILGLSITIPVKTQRTSNTLK